MFADAARTDGGMAGWPWVQQSQREMAKALFHAVSAAHRGALVDVPLCYFPVSCCCCSW